MSSHATLTAASDDRKARLAKLKSLKRKQPTEGEAEQADEAPAPQGDVAPPAATTTTTTTSATHSPTPPTNDVARLHLSGRNYDFETKGAKLGFEAPPTLNLDKPTLEQQAQDLEEESRRQAAVDAQDDKGIDLFKLQPKKPNWDLKRELNQRMAVLNVRTENAIARLVRERLAEKKAVAEAARGNKTKAAVGGMLDGAAIVEGMRVREREEEEENRREREAEAEEFGMA
ncbi:hypothetical protein N657DRAFT_575713 [Parathielavia appendiculata]|uniref:Uncharacterized protein n=1 Tax=Parathielavia appendiculata TaxID=2587402 RepID=A0AAN6TWY2_9PEZI|nr:hypothetical protein N657DRAFT_575713 [Parathielavia appendiculata]